MRRLRRIIPLLIIFLLHVSPLSGANYGKIAGVVTEAESGEPMAGVNVLIEGTSLGAASTEDGKYVILRVPPGTYGVRAQSIGHRSVLAEDVRVKANLITYVNFSMEQTALAGEEVTVIAERPVIEKDITATVRSVSSEEIEQIPTSTVSDVIRTQPGVVMSGGMHFRGGRSGEVTYYVDGVPLKDPLFSGVNSSEVINRSIIEEMQVISGTYSAEYGNSMSGVINISTREGGDRFSLTADAKFSGHGLEQESAEYNRSLLRMTFGGPLLLPKTRYFISAKYDGRDHYLPWGYQKRQSVYGKITTRSLNNITLHLAGNYSQGDRKSYSHSYKYIPEQYWYEPNTGSRMLQLGITHTLAENFFYSVNAYYSLYHYDSGDYDYTELDPSYRLDDNKEFYLQNYISSYSEDDQETMGIEADMVWQMNTQHEIKTGVEARLHRIDRFYISSPYYDDHTLEDYYREPREFAAYVQDKVDLSTIILNAGLRFDLSDPNAGYWPSPYHVPSDLTDNTADPDSYQDADLHSQLSPRLGVSYPVSDKTVFRFGYGHYFQRPDYTFMYRGHADRNAETLRDINGDGRIDADDNMLMMLLSGGGRFGDPDLNAEKTVSYEFGISHQLWDDFLLNLSVYSKKITNLTGTRTYFAGSDPGIWETYTLHINEDFAYNNGLEIQLRKRRGKYLVGEINYTYAVAEGSSSGPLERVGVEEANRQTLKFFPLDFDQRHTANANITLRIPENSGPSIFKRHIFEYFRGTLLFQYGSGLPYTKGIRGATEPYELNNKRLPAHWTFDLKLNRRIPLGRFSLNPYAEVYNLTDRRNVEYVDPFTGKPDEAIGQTTEYAANPLNWGPPRIIYLGLEIEL